MSTFNNAKGRAWHLLTIDHQKLPFPLSVNHRAYIQVKTAPGMRSSRWLLGLLALLVVLPGSTPGVVQPQPIPAEKHIVFVIGEREYQTRYTLPTFAE